MQDDSMNVARLLSSARYRFPERAKQDILNVLNMYRNLRPRLEKCTLPGGIKRELLVLAGTIPINYRNNTYHIPISIWILNNHPESAPLCWVKPTKDMTIKVSRHVDQAGRVYLPYLSDWSADTSDLLGVIQVMIIIFGETPPLYSRPSGSTSSTASASSTASYPSYTGGYPSANSNSGTPNPPYPTQFPNKYPHSSSYPAINPVMPTATSYPAPSTGSDSSASNPPYPPYPSYPMMPTPNYSPTASSIGSPKPGTINTDTIPKEHIRLSLLTAVEDKLKARSKEILSQCNAEIDVLKRTSGELTKGRNKLDNLVKEMENNLVELSKCKENIQQRDAKLTELIAKMESSDNQLNIDDYFGPVQPLYKQLFNAFVEENGIVDAIYYLNEALQKNVIDLDVFLKHVRELSRRQFMLRILIKLCREKAGLPM